MCDGVCKCVCGFCVVACVGQSTCIGQIALYEFIVDLCVSVMGSFVCVRMGGGYIVVCSMVWLVVSVE